MVDDYGIILVTLDHPDLAEPLLLANLDVDVTSRGQVFVAWPMQLKLPSSGNTPRRGSLTIEAVDGRIAPVVRGLKGHVMLTFDYVSRDDPDDVIVTYSGLVFSNSNGNDATISGEINSLGSLNDSWPTARATPDVCPGVFVS
jgi:hypothetical protein